MCEYWPPLENLPIFDVTVFRLAQKVVDFATTTNSLLINDDPASATTSYLGFAQATSGYTKFNIDSTGLTYLPSTNTLSCANFNGLASQATNIAGGIQYQIPYQSNVSTTDFLPNGSAGEILQSNGGLSPPSWVTPATPTTPTLADVLIAGNSADSTDIDMNSQNITNATAITATTFNGDLNGIADGSITIDINDYTALGTAYYLTFATLGSGQKNLFVDSASGITLNYQPDTSTLSCGNFQGVSSNAYLVRASDSNPMTATIYYLPFVDDANAGYYDLNTTTNLSYNISTQTLSAANFNGLVSTASLATQVTLSNTATGATNYLVMSSTNIGTSSLLTDTAGATYDSTTNTADINILGNAATATSSSTSSIANQVILSNTATGVINHLVLSDNNLGVSSLLTDNAGATYDSTTNTADINILGNAATATNSSTASIANQVYVTDTATGTTNYLVMTTTRFGNASLIVDDFGATYNSTNNTAAINISGNAATATTTTSVALTSDDTAGTYFIPFTKTTSPTSNALYIDDITTPLTYNPNTSTLTASNFSGLATNSTRIEVAASTSATTFYPTFCATGAGQKELRFNISGSPLSYVPSTNTLSATTFAGNATSASTASLASQVTLSNTATGATNYLVMSATNLGTSSLLTDNAGATYDSTTNTAAINISGNAATATSASSSTTSTTATNVALTSDDTNTTCYIPFSKTTSPTSNALFIDNTTTALTYNPANNEISVSQYSLGGLTPVSGNNAGFIAQNIGSSATVIQNQATSGSIFLNTRNALNALSTPLSVASTAVSFNATAIFNTQNITVSGTTINIGQGAGGASNLIVGNTNARNIVFSTGNNSIYGSNAGENSTAAASSNVFIGSSSGVGNTSGSQNVYCGGGSGCQALGGTGSLNVCLGNSSGSGLTVGSNQNTFLGSQSGYQTGASGTGNNNVAVGYQAGLAMSGASSQNTLVGTASAVAITSGVANTVCGFGAASGILTGSNNSVYGVNAGDNITGSDNICIGLNSTVPTAAGSNQIAIGTVNETMYIRGGFNFRVGTITNSTNGNLSAVRLAQYYNVTMSAASQTITLPNPTNAAYLGAVVTFKRKSNTTAYTITITGGGNVYLPVGSATLVASPVSVASGIFQLTLVCDGSSWNSINQA